MFVFTFEDLLWCICMGILIVLYIVFKIIEIFSDHDKK